MRCLNRQLPFLFLSGTQFITKYFPLHCQRLVRQAFLQSDLFLIYLSVPYHAEVDKDTFSITFLIRIFKVYNRIGQVHDFTFQQFISGKYIHHHISLFLRSPEAEHCRMLSIKFRICLIEPHSRFNRRTLILRREKNRIRISCHFLALCIFHRCFQYIRSGRKISPMNRHFFVRSERSCCHRLLIQFLEIRILGFVQIERTRHFDRLTIQILYLKYGMKRLIFTSLIS